VTPATPATPATRVLVTGSGGMLGRDVLAELGAARPGRVSPVEVTAATRSTLDVTDLDAVRAAVAGHDVVVNCTAWTKVDDAETQEAAAFTVNATAVGYLARACAEHGAALLHVSTDYVFPGDAGTPYAEDAPMAPVSAYGRTKAAGEWALRALLPERHWILRTAWLYGEHGPNFVATMARLEGQRETLDVVDDQRGQPTWSRDLAGRIADVIALRPPAGTYHATSSGETTWFGLARAVFEELGADPQRVRPTTSAAYVRPAPRPAYSVLGHDAWARAGLPPLRDWREALAEAMKSGLVAQPSS
jgi:dTDP-4-dehydrorhamnose reductase